MKLFFFIFFLFAHIVAIGQDKEVSVTKFGAVGDGKRDDSQAFQSALDYCGSRPSIFLRIPSGKYLLTKQLLVRNSITLFGGQRSELISDKKVSHNLFLFYDRASNVSIRGLIFNSAENNITPELMRFDGVNNITISECTFLGILPVAFNNASNINLLNNKFKSKSANPSGPCNFFTSSHILISGNTYDGASGIQFVRHCSYIRIYNNRFLNLKNYPIHFDGQDIQLHKFVLIKNNEFKGSGDRAYHGGTYDQISCYRVDKLQIINNKIDLGGDMGITLEESKNVFVANNNITRNNMAGISIANTKNCIIENNIIKDNGTRITSEGIDPKARSGIYLYGGQSYSSDSILIKDNSISFSDTKWKYYPIAVSTPPNTKHRLHFFNIDGFLSADSYMPVVIKKQVYDIWKNKLLSKIKF
ncbi:MAG: right-handed parallel beta-helix repeat-containing protein [Niabella sp.]